MFWIKLLIELVLFPFLYVHNYLVNTLSSKVVKQKFKQRRTIECKKVYVNIHEWGGYNLTRKKSIKNGKSFECGLLYQLKRFYGKDNVEASVTLSEAEKHKNLDFIKVNCNNFYSLSNRGLDFGGHGYFYERIKEKKDCYVVLTNSSVNRIADNDFLETHINYMRNNLEVGALGVSYSSKAYQTLIRNNFNPHIQSFYILTTLSVLNEIVKLNNGKFPGSHETDKRLLILNGEIKFSKLIMKAGYKLAFVTPESKVYEFASDFKWMNNGFNQWKLRHGDVRTFSDNPNKLYAIKN